MRIHNLYEDAQGVSHFRDIEVAWDEVRQSNKFSAREAASGIVFRETTRGFHTVDCASGSAPAIRNQPRQQGRIITAGDGETRYIGPG